MKLTSPRVPVGTPAESSTAAVVADHAEALLVDGVDPVEARFPKTDTSSGGAGIEATSPAARDYLRYFSMPKPVRILARSSSVTNSFINSIIPVIMPTNREVKEALSILGMLDSVECAFCGDTWTEWDHLRPLVIAKRPTGYISEIHNLVPACGKCNQSKGNKPWRSWMFGPAKLSPRTRGVEDVEIRADRLTTFEQWKPPTVVDFDACVDQALWSRHWENNRRILDLMREAQDTASLIRESIRAQYAQVSHSPNGTDAV